MADALVSVVIPAHNAAATVVESLRSARAQTHAALDIVVVDDGSTDDTASLVRAQMREDSRIRILHQSHSGVSAARNLGIRAALGELIAPLDADDLWRPTKIERQVHAMRSGGDRVGLVYTWFALIDREGRILSAGYRPKHSGDVLRACCRESLVGNGSGALMRRSAILECGGYDERLLACEDLKLYIAIAERYHYAIVPEHLTGYRESNANLTSNVGLMLRSAESVVADVELRHPEFRAELRQLRVGLCHWLLRRGLRARRFAETWHVARTLWQLDAFFAARSVAALPLDLLTSTHARAAAGANANAALDSFFLVYR